MIKEVDKFKETLTRYLEIDDLEAVDIVLATAVSHKIPHTEMLWLRVIGASGAGKTEVLRSLAAQDGYCSSVESLTPGAIRRGYYFKKDAEHQKPLLERLNGSLVVTKEFAVVLTKNQETQKEIFGLLRGVHDGILDAEYGSEEGHLHQESRFDWILGTTQYVERQRQLETLLGSRFIDLKWGRPIGEADAVTKAINNDPKLAGIRGALADDMTEIIVNTVPFPKPKLDYLPTYANIAAMLRTPVERDTRTGDVYDLPDIELGTRFGQAMSRLSQGLLMIGVTPEGIKPYMKRMVMDSMSKKRAAVVKCQLEGITKQQDIADRVQLSVGYVNKIIEDLRLLGWNDDKLRILRG